MALTAGWNNDAPLPTWGVPLPFKDLYLNSPAWFYITLGSKKALV